MGIEPESAQSLGCTSLSTAAPTLKVNVFDGWRAVPAWFNDPNSYADQQ